MARLTAVASPEENESIRPLPWRRMAWVTWRQHRAALTGLAVFLGALTLYVLISGLQLHDAYGAAIACHPAGSLACSGLVGEFDGTGNFLASGLLLQAVPVLIGVFLGAPLLAREMETGTFRYAWTQGFGRWRWTLAKLVGFAVVVTVATSAISALFSWYYQPYFAAGNPNLGLTEMSPFAPGLFDLREVALPAWSLAAFAVGALVGMLIRRVVPTIVASLVVYVGLAFAAGSVLREHYLAPIVTSRLDVFDPAWILSRQWMKAGRLVSQTVLSEVLAAGPPQLQGKGGVPESLGTWRYLVQHGYTQLTTYQPNSRFWSFQWIEGGWLLALSVLLIAMAIWLVRRRAA